MYRALLDPLIAQLFTEKNTALSLMVAGLFKIFFEKKVAFKCRKAQTDLKYFDAIRKNIFCYIYGKKIAKPFFVWRDLLNLYYSMLLNEQRPHPDDTMDLGKLGNLCHAINIDSVSHILGRLKKKKKYIFYHCASN